MDANLLLIITGIAFMVIGAAIMLKRTVNPYLATFLICVAIAFVALASLISACFLIASAKFLVG